MRVTTKNNGDGTHRFYVAQPSLARDASPAHRVVEVASDDPRLIEWRRLTNDLADYPAKPG